MTAFDGTNGPALKVQFYKSAAWTDVSSADIRQVQIKRGSPRKDQQPDAGTMTVVFDNTSGIYDPDNLSASSPWVVSGASILRAGLRARFIATWSGVDYVLYVGKLESNSAEQAISPTAMMTFVDGLADLGQTSAPALDASSYAGETTAARVGRMLDLIGWYGARSLSGSVTMAATTQGMSCLDMVRQCVNVEAGRFYISRDGVATLKPLSDKFSRPTQLLFSDARPQPANTVEYDGLRMSPGALQVVNQCVIDRSGSVTTATYNPSVTAYTKKSVTVDAPTNTDAQAEHLAVLYSFWTSSPETTVEAVEFSALALGALYPDFLAVELGDQVTVHRTTVDGRTLTPTLVVEGMSHDITPNSWRVSYSTSPLNPYTTTI